MKNWGWIGSVGIGVFATLGCGDGGSKGGGSDSTGGNGGSAGTAGSGFAGEGGQEPGAGGTKPATGGNGGTGDTGGSAGTGGVTSGGAGESAEGGAGGQVDPPFIWSEEPLGIECPEGAICIEGRRAFSTGGAHACAVSTAGKVYCWGGNSYGQLGDGTTDASALPVEVPGITDAISVDAGDSHTCVVRSGGKVSCWGSNSGGQLGNGIELELVEYPGYPPFPAMSEEFSSTPIEVPGLSNVVQVSADYDKTCAVVADGTARCWGFNDYGDIGNGSLTPATSPATVVGLDSVLEIETSYQLTCARLASGKVSCWGYKFHIGDGAPIPPPDDYYYYTDPSEVAQPVPVEVADLDQVTSISGNVDSMCALDAGGALACWGYGYPDPDDEQNFFGNRPIVIAENSGATTIATGSADLCYTRPDGTAACWTTTLEGEPWYEIPVTATRELTSLPDLNGVVALYRGGGFDCARRKDGSIACWGDYDQGQLGDGEFAVVGSSVPLPLALDDATWSSIGAGLGAACGILTSGGVACWGSNSAGGLGADHQLERSTVPLPFTALGSVTAVAESMGGGCALPGDGTVECWGDASSGRLGTAFDETTEYFSSEPVTIAGLSDAVGVATAGAASCAVLGDGTVQCWGTNSTGLLGTLDDAGLPAESATPLEVPGLTEISKVSMGSHACALKEDGTVWCWGDNYNGLLGAGFATPIAAPLQVEGLSGVEDVAVGLDFTCALLSDETVACWGTNAYGELGDGLTTDNPVPTAIAGLTGVKSIGAGLSHACALHTSGKVTCWGSNSTGQLGNGAEFVPGTMAASGGPPNPPVEVVGVTDAQVLAVGGNNSCVIDSAGAAECWGGNLFGNLGAGEELKRSTPMDVVWP